MSTCHDSPADCHSRLLQAAGEIFATEGYRAGVDRIAEHAGVAKQTLYNHFPSKAELFGAVISRSVDDMLIPLGDAALPLRERLVRFAVRYREHLLSPAGLGFFRALVAESQRFPELAASFYRSGPQVSTSRLAGVLAEAMAQDKLRVDSPEFAAGMLLSMLVGAERSRLLFSGDAPNPDPLEAERIVDCFLRAFAPDIP